ncbi:MAG: phosphatidylserine decarboxylase, partial [Halobacteriota archaeon]
LGLTAAFERALPVDGAMADMRIAPGGLRLAAVGLVIALAVGAVGAVTLAIAIGFAAVAVVVFYRDPDRQPAGDGLLAAADGRIRAVETTDDGRVRLVTFLNLWDVHVVRSPWAASVRATSRVRGGHRPAFLPSAHANVGMDVEFERGFVAMRAGLVARRVRTYVAPGDVVDRGDRIGHIAFGSRVDVILPAGIEPTDLAVAKGDRVTAGETVIARPGDAPVEPPR